MQVTAEHLDPCTVVLDINVDEQQVVQAFEIAYKEFGRYANVPGFRPGKAPRAIVERYVNKEKVRQHALEKLIRDSYFQALEEQSIAPYRDPRIDPTDLEDKKPYAYKATVPLEPQITLGDYTGLAVDKPVYKVTEANVEERLTALREERARLERVADRGVQEGDILIAEQQVIVEGDEGEPTPMRRQLIQLGNNVPGFDDAVMGMEIGEERTFELHLPRRPRGRGQAGQKGRVHRQIQQHQRQKDARTQRRVRQNARRRRNRRGTARTACERACRPKPTSTASRSPSSACSTKYWPTPPFISPPCWCARRWRTICADCRKNLRQSNVGYGQYLQSLGGISAEQHQAGLAQQAALQIRTLLALREISIQEDLQATDEQVDAEFDRLLSEGTVDEEQYAEFKADGRRRLQVANALIQQRLHDVPVRQQHHQRSGADPPFPTPKPWKTRLKKPKFLPVTD